jgi:hypothetical protein
MYVLQYDGSTWLFSSESAAVESAKLTWSYYGPLIRDEAAGNARRLCFGNRGGYKEIWINRVEPISVPKELSY